MPELPEVQTIVDDLNKKIIGLKILDAWTDWEKSIKFPKNFKQFKKEIIGRKILKVWRRGKNILIELAPKFREPEGNKLLLIHQKLTGHLLLGKWILKNNNWIPKIKGPLEEKVNNYIHLMLYLDNGEMLALSDLRKFAKIMIGNKDEILNLPEIKKLGPEPLEKDFDFEKFKFVLKNQKQPIKQVLMNQEVISGIGNIYSDEILWEAKVYPLKPTNKLTDKEKKSIFLAIKKILNKAIKLRGDSMSDYRDIYGREGGYQRVQNVYQREGEKCLRCDTIIKRFKINNRSGHYCPKCQK